MFGITNNRDTTRSQAFAYDYLNRLQTAETTSTFSNSPANCWAEKYVVDPVGNLTSIGSTGNSNYNGCVQESGLSISVNGNNQISGFCYDAAGDLLAQSPSPCPSPTYVYDSESRLTSADGVSYTYDGDGMRVEKSNGTLYWYGMSSDPIAETDASGNTTNEYIFFNGKRIARRDASGSVFYYFADHLGTARETIQAGATSPCYDADFYPFGGERVAVDTCDSHYKFTGKERDSESGLDTFGARYNSSQYGRFMSPDDIGPCQHPEDPQTWNMYSYVRNNPLSLVDPTGQYICDSNSVSQQQCDNFQAGLDKAQEAANNLKSQYGADSDQYKNAQAAIDAYGQEGVNNGVTIAQGNTGKYAAETQVAGTTVTPTDNNPNGQNIRVTLNQSMNLLGGTTNADNLGILEAHEGSHVADASAWVSSGFSPSMDPTRYQMEFKAYQVSANLYNALGYMAATASFAGRSYLLTSTLPAWTPNYTTTAINGIIKNEYPNANLAAFSRNTKLPKP